MIKGLLEKALVRVTAGFAARSHETIILSYHNVVPDEADILGDRSLHVTRDRFRRHLDVIQKCGQSRTLVDALTNDGDGNGPHIVLTFDDAYRGAIEIGVPECVARDLPCVVFVAPGLLGARSFWWDEAASLPGGLTPERREDFLTQAKGRGDLIRDRIRSQGPAPRLSDWHACADQADLEHAGALSGVSFGSHSWSHPNLASLDSDSLTLELEQPLRWLQERGWNRFPSIAYPYGLHSPAVEQACRRAGYHAGLTVEGSWLSRDRDPMRISRLNVPSGLSPEGLILRLRGVWNRRSSSA